MIDYNYKAKSEYELISEMYKSEIQRISELPETLCLIDNGSFKSIRSDAYSKFFDTNKTAIKMAVNNENKRVFKNLATIPLNTTVRVSDCNLVQRVPNGWLYMTEIYNNRIDPSVINIVTTFVPEVKR